MLKRVITGTVYFAVIVAFFALRGIDKRLFGILIYAFSLIGTYEMVQAFNKPRTDENGLPTESPTRMSEAQRVFVYGYALLFVPCFYFAGFIDGQRSAVRTLLTLSFIFAMMLLVLLVVDYKHSGLIGTGISALCGIYPTGILSTMLLINEFPDGWGSALGLLLVFGISPVADTAAFFVGSLIKGKKLCPTISPKKTISGAIGGLVFGMGAGMLLYWLYTLATGYEYMGIFHEWAGAPWVVFAVIGFVCALATEFGDLVESAIKRKIGIKDMGKLLPGHGGILDRIDGTLFASLFIYFAFILFVLPR